MPHTIKHSIQKHIVDEVKFLEGGIVTLIESETRSTATEGKGENIVVAHVDFSKHQKDGSPPLLNVLEKEIFTNETLYKEVFSNNGTEDYTRNKEEYLLGKRMNTRIFFILYSLFFIFYNFKFSTKKKKLFCLYFYHSSYKHYLPTQVHCHYVGTSY